MDVAESHRTAGNYREAGAAFEEASKELTRLGRDQTQTAGTLFNNWGLVLAQLGRPLDAERVFRRAIDISRVDANEETVSPMLLINYARVLRDLGRVDEAADYVDRGYAKARQVDAQVVIYQSLFLQSVIHLDRNDLARMDAVLDELEPIVRRRFTVPNIAFVVLASNRSLLAQRRGDLEAGLRLADEAMAALDVLLQTGRQGKDYLPTLLLRRSGVELALGRLDAAQADAARGLELWRATCPPGMFVSTVGRAYLALGRALDAQGKRDEARAAFRSAAENLGDALGPDHEDSRAAAQLAEP
jgi:tetratricopeptide (TPR) repeat protein